MVNDLFCHTDVRFAIARDGDAWVSFPHSYHDGWKSRILFKGDTSNLKPINFQIRRIAIDIAGFPAAE